MKALLLLTVSSCALTPKVPVMLYKTANTTISDETINETYLLAQDMFGRSTGCSAPKIGTLVVKDDSLQEINRGNNIFSKDGIGVKIGEYGFDSHIIRVVKTHPDRVRILFHEILHFMFHTSTNCQDIAGDEFREHTIIRYLTVDYVKRTKRAQDVGDEWLCKELKTFGFKEPKTLGLKCK